MALYSVGLDLGQANDYSALAVVEHVRYSPQGYTPAEVEHAIDSGMVDIQTHHNVVALKRWPLGTSYVSVVDDVSAIMSTPALIDDGFLFIDATGVGRAVIDLFWERYRKGEMGHRNYVPVTFTAQSKKDMIDGMLIAFQQNRMGIATGLPLGAVLEKEILGLRQKISAAGNTSYDTNVKDGHGDIATALQLAMLHERTWGGMWKARLANREDAL